MGQPWHRVHQSQAISLNPGQNTVTVAVTAADGVTTKNYTITANLLSQEAYAKASNTDAADLFGWSVALIGDTLAVRCSLWRQATLRELMVTRQIIASISRRGVRIRPKRCDLDSAGIYQGVE